MPLAKQIIKWPLTGGLNSKQAPFMMAPGSHTDIVNLRQERLNEWRPRFGSVATSTVPGDTPVRVVSLPGNSGALGLNYQTDFASAGRIYSPSASPTWSQMQAAACQQSSIPSWSRKTVTANRTRSTKVSTCMKPGGYQLTAWTDVDSLSGNNIIRIAMSAGGIDKTPSTNTFSGGVVAPCCVYDTTHDLLCLFYIDTVLTQIRMVTWSGTTGAGITGTTAISTVAVVGTLLDAVYYGGNTITQYPMTIYPRHVVTGLTYLLPLAFVNWYPALFVLDKPDPHGFPEWLRFASPLAAVVLSAVAAFVWRRGVRHYASTGS